MPDTAALRLARIVALLAELPRRVERGEEAPRLEALAEKFGVSAAEIACDVRTLAQLGDHADAGWLLSLGMWQQEDRVAISSAGPFGRPIRLTPDELLALRIALAVDPEGPAVAGKLRPLLSPPPRGKGATPAPGRREAPADVRVRFAPRIAGWVREHYTCADQPDGSVVATLKASSTAWLVRRVLEFGPDAEVLGPAEYRAAVRSAVA